MNAKIKINKRRLGTSSFNIIFGQTNSYDQKVFRSFLWCSEISLKWIRLAKTCFRFLRVHFLSMQAIFRKKVLARVVSHLE